MKIDKVAGFLIYVEDIEQGRKFWGDLLGATFGEPFENPRMGTIGSVARDVPGMEWVELIEGIPGGVVYNAIQKKGVGLGGLFINVPDFEEALAEAERKGIRVVKAIEGGPFMVATLHPKDTRGVFLDLHGPKPAKIDKQKYPFSKIRPVTEGTRKRGVDPSSKE